MHSDYTIVEGWLDLNILSILQHSNKVSTTCFYKPLGAFHKKILSFEIQLFLRVPAIQILLILCVPAFGHYKGKTLKVLDLGSGDTKKDRIWEAGTCKMSWTSNEKMLANCFLIKNYVLKTFFSHFLCPISVQKALDIATPSL